MYEPKDNDVNNLVQDHVKANLEAEEIAFLGVTDKNVEGVWTYATDQTTELLLTPNWITNEPNGGLGKCCKSIESMYNQNLF